MIDYAFPGLLNYWIVFLLMMIGLYIVIAHENLIKKNRRVERVSGFSLCFLYFYGEN